MGKLFLIAALSLVASGASASIVNIDISLRIDRISWSGVDLIYIDDDKLIFEENQIYEKGEFLPEFNQVLDLKTPFPTRNVGDVIDFKATIDNAALDFGNAPSCMVDAYDCSFNSNYYVNQAQAGTKSFRLTFDTVDLVSFFGSTQPGEKVTMQWADSWGGGSQYVGGPKELQVYWWNHTVDMTVVRNNLSPCQAFPSNCQPAVMPLPSSLGFLLTGFLGLAATQARRFRLFNRSNRKHA